MDFNGPAEGFPRQSMPKCLYSHSESTSREVVAGIQLNPQLIFALGIAATKLASRHLNVPIIFSMVNYERHGFRISLTSPVSR